MNIELIVKVDYADFNRGIPNSPSIQICVALHTFQWTTLQKAKLGLLLKGDDTMLLHLDAWSLIKVLRLLLLLHQKGRTWMILLADILSTSSLELVVFCRATIYKIIISEKLLFSSEILICRIYHDNICGRYNLIKI